MSKIKIAAGLDIGNGYVKGKTEADGKGRATIDIPSCVASVANPTDLAATDIAKEIGDIFNRATVTFDSPLVTGIFAATRSYLGRRGVESGKPINAFDIDNHVSKADQPLSAVLILSIIASAALQSYYETNKALPTETIQVEAKLAVALPITEYKTHRDRYGDGFMKNTHIVSFHNFETPVRVEIKFANTFVAAEGASAQIAIIKQGEPFINSLLDGVRTEGIKLAGITGNDIINATGTLGIDIGEGTVNFPVFTNSTFNTDFSANIAMGYGTVLENSLAALQAANNIFHDRKSLGEFLNTEPSALKRRKYDNAASIVKAESMTLVDAIVKEFARVLNKANGQIEVVYVYGGGSAPIKELLYPALIQTAKSFSAGDDFPIMYLNATYSRFLNCDGLFKLALAK